EIDSVGPANLVNVDAAIGGVGEALVIPLLQATSGELELTLLAHRKMAPGARKVALELPRPAGDVMGASVAVVSDDNIELLPQPDESTSLAPLADHPRMTLPERQQDPLYYRATGEAAKFVAGVTVHDQSIATSVATDVEVSADESRVE